MAIRLLVSLLTVLLVILSPQMAFSEQSPSPSPSPSSSPSPSPSPFSPSPNSNGSDDESPSPAPFYSPPSDLPPTPAPSNGAPSPPEINHSDNLEAAKEDSGDKMKGGQKAGVAIGVIAGACVVGVGALVYKKRQNNIRRSEYSYAARRDIL